VQVRLSVCPTHAIGRSQPLSVRPPTCLFRHASGLAWAIRNWRAPLQSPRFGGLSPKRAGRRRPFEMFNSLCTSRGCDLALLPPASVRPGGHVPASNQAVCLSAFGRPGSTPSQPNPFLSGASPCATKPEAPADRQTRPPVDPTDDKGLFAAASIAFLPREASPTAAGFQPGTSAPAALGRHAELGQQHAKLLQRVSESLTSTEAPQVGRVGLVDRLRTLR
jgi:hypothetical protein